MFHVREHALLFVCTGPEKSSNTDPSLDPIFIYLKTCIQNVTDNQPGYICYGM